MRVPSRSFMRVPALESPRAMLMLRAMGGGIPSSSPPDEATDGVAAREAGADAVSMLPEAAGEIGRHAGVDRAAEAAGQDIGEGDPIHPRGAIMALGHSKSDWVAGSFSA